MGTWDSRIAKGEIVVTPAEKILTEVEIAALKKEYSRLKSDYGLNANILHEAQQRLVEEISSEGFGSQKTRRDIAHYEAETDKAQGALDSFRSNNPEFMTILKAEAEAESEKAIERLWNS